MVPAMTPMTRSGTDFANTVLPWTRDDRCSIVERGDEYLLTFELPGFDPSEITLRYDDGVLRVLAEQTVEGEISRRYRQSITLHEELEASDIEAEYDNGMLLVTFPIEKLLYERGEEIDIST